MIAFHCGCGQRFKVKREFAGRKTSCPACKQPLVVPDFDATQVLLPKDQIIGTPSSAVKAGIEGGVILDPATGSLSREILARGGANKERYVIEGEIARGGMGAVLRAVDCDIRREVAVKYLLNQADARSKSRFVDEAQITGQLEHPNIPPIHELGVDGERRLYFSMKLIKGRSLADALDDLRKHPKTAEREWPLGRLLNIFVNVCNGLGYAHSRGVIHRDLKPANIMIGDFGEVYVMDWGLAKVVKSEAASSAPPAAALPAKRSSKVETSREPGSDLTLEGSILGTPVYMSPEQASGRVNDLDARSDVYSLGAILYEILTLQPPVDRDGGYLAVLMRVMEGAVIPPERREEARARNGKIPGELAAIAMKALARDRAQRYADVDALRRDVERYQEGRSVSAKDDSVKEMAWKLIKRNKLASAFTAVLGLVLLAVLIVGRVSQIQVSRAKADADAKQKELVDRTRQAVPALVIAARQLANTGELDGARKQVELALLYDPDDVAAHLLHAQLLLGEKDWTGAAAELEHYLERRSDPTVRTLLNICRNNPSSDAAIQYRVAQLLKEQNMPGPAVPLVSAVAAEKKKRAPLLALYRNKIEASWKGLGSRLTLQDDAQFDLNFDGCKQVSTLEPLRGIPLERVRLPDCVGVNDLSPLADMPVWLLDLRRCERVTNLSPVSRMPLKRLMLGGCRQLDDLTPLRGRPIAVLDLGDCTKISDLTPLAGMRLTHLNLRNCSKVTDLTPLHGMPLTSLELDRTRVGDLKPLKGAPLKRLTLPETLVTDLTPVQGMPLESLNLYGCRGVKDLTPLHGSSLVTLDLLFCDSAQDLTPLRGLHLHHIMLNPATITKGMDVLREMKTLKTIQLWHRALTAEEFWRRYDAGEFRR